MYLPKHSIRLHLLTTPLRITADPDKAEESRFAWRVQGSEYVAGDGPVRYVKVYALTPLGILHSLFGTTVEVR